MNDKKWKILIVTCDKIVPQYYQNDKSFNKDNWSFFNVSRNKLESNDFDVVNSSEIEGYEYLGKDWAESEVIYNIGKLNLFSEYDYIGIIHWDFNLYASVFGTYRITENISNILDKFDWISFFPAFYSNITGFYDVMMDERMPNCLFRRNAKFSDARSCNEYIKEKLNISDEIEQNKTISLCCSFLTKRDNFIELSKIIASVKDSHDLDKFDTEKRHRYPGQFMERLIAIYSTKFNQFNFKLDHRFTGGLEINKSDPNGENY